jgi:integrase
MPKLTKRVVEAAEPKGRDYFVWCDELPGFGVRVFASGKRSYLVQYRAAGRTRRVTIGLHGPITTEEARKEALALLGRVAKGANPAEERANLRQALTVKELCDAYLAAAEKGLIMGKGGRAKKERTLDSDRGRIEWHIVPLLGRRLVRDLTRSDIERFIRDVMAGKTATVAKSDSPHGKIVVKGGSGAAARTAGLLGGILTFAISEGVISQNPAAGVRRPSDGQRELRLSPEDYRTIGRALQQAEEEAETWQAVAGAWLMMLTGCRFGEIERLRWSEVDRAGMCFRLDDTKEGAAVRPIGNPVFRVLERLEPRPGCPYVLPGIHREGYYKGLQNGWERIADRAGLPQVTPHILRHSFASVAADLGYSEPTIGAMLGHSKGTVTSRYIHHLDSVLISAADRVARTIHGFMTGEAGAVVELATARSR